MGNQFRKGKMAPEETAEVLSPRKRKYLAISLLAAIIIISVGGSIFLIFNWEYVEQLENRGLLGLFIISLFAGSPIPIPTPSMILTLPWAAC